jgi:hypothetical protein
MKYLKSPVLQKIFKIILISGLSFTVIFVAWIYFNYKFFGYKDFTPTTYNKPNVFQDSIKPYLITHTSKRNFDNDSLFYFNYKENSWIVCWSSEHYKNLSIKNIIEMKDKSFGTKDLKSYFYYSLGNNCPIKIRCQARIDEKKSIVLAINKCVGIKQKILTKNMLAFNLKCSEIGIGSLNGFLDFDLEITKSHHLGNLVIFKSINRLYIILMIPIKEEDLNLIDLSRLLNLKT